MAHVYCLKNAETQAWSPEAVVVSQVFYLGVYSENSGVTLVYL